MRWKTTRFTGYCGKLSSKSAPRKPQERWRSPPRRPGPTGVSLCRKAGLVSYSTSEIWRVGGMEGVEGKTISTPLAVA